MEKCSKHSISKKQFHIFSGKTIVIDTSIYLYKFMENAMLIENMYLLISILHHYNTTPIFVFDGKPPKEKANTLIKRKLEKQEAETKFNELKQEMITASSEQKKEIEVIMERLKKQFVRIKKEDIDAVKILMDHYGVSYVTADGEADKLCAEMVIQKKAWACLSDDMDLFAYGCTRVLRHLSLLNHTVIYYNVSNILRDLKMSLRHFQEIIVLSGTDYNIQSSVSLYKSINYYNDYTEDSTITISFYEWLKTKGIETNHLQDIVQMFDITEKNDTVCENIKRPRIKLPELKEWLYNYGFVFI